MYGSKTLRGGKEGKGKKDETGERVRQRDAAGDPVR